jgi:hypothetical protein
MEKNLKKDVMINENGIASISVRFPSEAQVASELKRAKEKGFDAPKAPLLATLKLTLDSGFSVVGIKYVKSDYAGSIRADKTVAPKGFLRMPSFRMDDKYIDYVTVTKEQAYFISTMVDAVLDKELADATPAAPVAEVKAPKAPKAPRVKKEAKTA